MNNPNILFVSWQGGMGHVTRDLAIVKELRKIAPEINVSWIAHPQAAKFLLDSGEKLIPETKEVSDYNLVGAQILQNFRLDLVKYAKLSSNPKQNNAKLLEKVQNKYQFDLIVGDEIYGPLVALAKGNIKLNVPIIMIEDFIRYQSLSKNPLMRIVAFSKNRLLSSSVEKTASQITHFFVGEWEDIPNKRFDIFLPHCRDFAKKHYEIIGYILRFDPKKYQNKKEIREKLGYGSEQLVICATGGTAAGKELLELCGKAYTILKKEISDLRMIFVCGELYGKEPPKLPPDVELHRFLHNIYEHYAACDLAVVVGGGTTTIELTALKVPFIFFPIDNQFDQQIYVSNRILRHKAGIRMEYRKTTPEKMAVVIKDNIGKKPDTPKIPFNGAQKAAEIIAKRLIN